MGAVTYFGCFRPKSGNNSCVLSAECLFSGGQLMRLRGRVLTMSVEPAKIFPIGMEFIRPKQTNIALNFSVSVPQLPLLRTNSEF
jgi:hypothetical protein